jgi:hypothetical protein
MPVRYAVAISIVFLAAACRNQEERTLDVPTRMTDEQIITLCGAGYVRGGEADLAAELERSGGRITAGFKDLFAARALDNREGLRSTDIDKMYGRFLECLDKRITERNHSEGTFLISKHSIFSVSQDGTSSAGEYDSENWLGTYEHTIVYTNTNKFAVGCIFEIYYRDTYTPRDGVKYNSHFYTDEISAENLADISIWISQSTTPTDCAEFYRQQYDVYANYSYTKETVVNQILLDIAIKAERLMDRCASHDGYGTLERGYINFEAGETKELKFSGIEKLPHPPYGMGVTRVRDPLIKSCWRA